MRRMIGLRYSSVGTVRTSNGVSDCEGVVAEVETVVERVEIDPVCGMKVRPEKAAGSMVHGGKTWYFCGKGCVAKFAADPAKYDGSVAVVEKPVVEQAVAGVKYVCPMHPEVVSDRPGACPKCGM